MQTFINKPKFPEIQIGFKRNGATAKRGSKRITFSIDKRQKFVVTVLLLSLGLFLSEYQFNKSGVYATLILAVFTDVFLFWAIRTDLRENKQYQVFILPFLYSLAFGLFYFLTPTVFISQLLLTAVYAFGLYSLLLSQNIFIVSSVRTIQLLSVARIVSFVITLVSFFLLTNIVFTLHVTIFPVLVLLLVFTYLFIFHSLWTYSLQKNPQPLMVWVSALTVCIVEVGTVLWFWPSSPTVIALFLTGFCYSLVGLSHIWFEKRLFKGILWEYVWVGCIVFFVLILFTGWGK